MPFASVQQKDASLNEWFGPLGRRCWIVSACYPTSPNNYAKANAWMSMLGLIDGLRNVQVI